jgi:hypothetical protein
MFRAAAKVIEANINPRRPSPSETAAAHRIERARALVVRETASELAAGFKEKLRANTGSSGCTHQSREKVANPARNIATLMRRLAPAALKKLLFVNKKKASLVQSEKI